MYTNLQSLEIYLRAIKRKNSCLYVIFATDYMPGGFGYYRRYGPYPIDIKNMYWSTINSKEFNARILHPCIGRKN